MRFEKTTSANFDEQKYIVANPDVAAAVQRKEFKSGFEHFQRCGNLEDRYQKITLQSEGPLAIVHVPKCAGTSLRIEVDSISPTMYKSQKYSIRNEKNYFFPRHSREKTLELESQGWRLSELARAREQHDCVMGHISLKHFWQAGFRDIVGVVREPRTRILSEWVFLTTTPEYREAMKRDGLLDAKKYFSRYILHPTYKSLSKYKSLDVIFDSNIQALNVRSYWNNEIPELMKEVFGQPGKSISANEAKAQTRDVDFRILDLLNEASREDLSALNRLKNANLLTWRSEEQMEMEFQQYLKKNFNYVRRLL